MKILRAAVPALVTFSFACPPGAMAQATLRNLTLQSHLNEYPSPLSGGTDYSACCSYVHSDGREYAVIGVGDGNLGSTSEGTAIYNVTNPAGSYRVGFIPGPQSLWREMKQYRDWIYVVTEGTGVGEGVQIIRMTDPEHPVLAATYTGSFHRSHTVSVDATRALLICNGTRVWGGGSSYYFAGLRVLSLANPEAPVEIGHWPATMPSGPQADTFYVHDSVPVGNRLYASSVYYGIQRILDFTDPTHPVQTAAWTYPGGFSHNSWPDASGNWLYVTDEKNGEPLKIFDITNPSAPVLFNTWTSNPTAIVHNAHVKGLDLYLANYTEGIRVLDATDPGHPAEFAYADTWPGASGDYNGVWEVSNFPSGTVIASDRSTGLWVFRVQRNYGLERITAVNAATSQPIAGARVFLDGADSLTTTADGVAVFAPDPGSHIVTASRFGYHPASVLRGVVQGATDAVTLALAPRETAAFTGTVRSAATQAPLADAELDLDYTPLHAHSDAGGFFTLDQVPVDAYRVVVRCPGYIPVAFTRDVGPGDAAMDFQLVPAPFYDPLESGPGWTVGAASDNATSGAWTRVDPVGTWAGNAGTGWGSLITSAGGGPSSFVGPGASPAHEGHNEVFGLTPGPVQPEDDRSPSGTMCFVTGQGASSAAIDQADVDYGRTTLTSPALDMTGKAIPTIGFWRWFYTNTPGGPDYFSVLISNDDGVQWTPVETTNDVDNHWEERAVRVADYVTPTSQVRLRFVAADEGGLSVVEVAVDDITVYDGATLAVGAAPDPGEAPSRLRLRGPWPNPAAGTVRAVLMSPRPGRARVEVFDLQGRKVAAIFEGLVESGSRVIEWNGADSGGRPAEAGIYLLVARAGGASATARFVVMR